MSTHCVLVVDDDQAITALLEGVLLSEGYRVSIAHDGEEALAKLALNEPDLILTDLDMPRMNGNELCRRVKLNPKTRLLPVIMITARDEQETKLRAWELGADEFLTKPFDVIEVLARCRSLLRIKQLVDELDSAESIVFALARTVEAKCRFTWGHSERVMSYALKLAQRAGVSGSEQAVLKKGALLHDIGKIHIPDAILNKPGPLTKEEFDVVKQHPVQGVHIVEPLHSVRDTIPLIRWHHERMDGKGYPDALSGVDIPLLARILAVADVYDAVSSDRPYRPALSKDVCIDVLKKSAATGGHDSSLVKLFAASMNS